MQGCKVSCDTGTKDLVPSFGSPTRPLGSASTVLWWQLELAANGSSVFRNLESLCLVHLNKIVTIYRILEKKILEKVSAGELRCDIPRRRKTKKKWIWPFVEDLRGRSTWCWRLSRFRWVTESRTEENLKGLPWPWFSHTTSRRRSSSSFFFPLRYQHFDKDYFGLLTLVFHGLLKRHRNVQNLKQQKLKKVEEWTMKKLDRLITRFRARLGGQLGSYALNTGKMKFWFGKRRIKTRLPDCLVFNQSILLFSCKDRRTESWIRRKGCHFFYFCRRVGRENLIRTAPDKSKLSFVWTSVFLWDALHITGSENQDGSCKKPHH